MANIVVSSDQRRRGEHLADQMIRSGGFNKLAIRLEGLAQFIREEGLDREEWDEIGVELAEYLACVMKIKDSLDEEGFIKPKKGK